MALDKVIDVSKYQGIIDWKKVKKAGIKEAIIKCVGIDKNKNKVVESSFERNWKGASDAGVKIKGVYDYSYATTVQKAQSDARTVVKVLGSRKTTVYFDTEDSCQKNMGKALINIINAYAEIIIAAGHKFGIYTGLSYYNSFLKPYANELPYPFWMARYPSTKPMTVADDPNMASKPKIVNKLVGWQYSSSGSIDGISGRVDMNIFFDEDTTETKPITPTTTTSTYTREDFVKEVQKIVGMGQTGKASTILLSKTVTISRKKNNKHALVKPIQKFLNANGCDCGTADGIAGKKFDAAMKKYQSWMVKPDGEATAKGKTWKKMIGMIP